MISLFKSGYSKIMKLFYEDKLLSIHLREISRRTKIHVPSVTKFLNMLEKDKVLKCKKEGNLKKYQIIRDKRTYLIFEAFDIENFEKLPNIRKTAIETYLKKLPKKPIFVVLFGSTAKRNYKKESDIDLLLVSNSKISVNKAKEEVAALTAMEINTFQIPYKTFLKDLKLKEEKVIHSAINSGYPLINHIKYYEVLFNERI